MDKKRLDEIWDMEIKNLLKKTKSGQIKWRSMAGGSWGYFFRYATRVGEIKFVLSSYLNKDNFLRFVTLKRKTRWLPFYQTILKMNYDGEGADLNIDSKSWQSAVCLFHLLKELREEKARKVGIAY